MQYLKVIQKKVIVGYVEKNLKAETKESSYLRSLPYNGHVHKTITMTGKIY